MVAYESLKAMKMSSWVIPAKSGRGRLWERSLYTRSFHYKVQVTVQTGFHKGGRNYTWSLTRVVARRALTVSCL